MLLKKERKTIIHEFREEECFSVWKGTLLGLYSLRARLKNITLKNIRVNCPINKFKSKNII